MLHLAIVGSLERFIGIPDRATRRRAAVWLALRPSQRADDHRRQADYASEVAKTLQNKDLEWPRICGTRKLPIKSASIRCRRFRTFLVVGDKGEGKRGRCRAPGNQGISA